MIGIAALLLVCAPAELRVIDGDTFDCGGERVRLAATDAPERGQPGFRAAKAGLARLTSGGARCRIVDRQAGRVAASGFVHRARLVGVCGGGVDGRAGDLRCELIRAGVADDGAKWRRRYRLPRCLS